LSRGRDIGHRHRQDRALCGDTSTVSSSPRCSQWSVRAS